MEISDKALRAISCKCSIDGSQLTVDCLGRADVDGQQLSRQLDTLLSSNLTFVTELSIVNTPLTQLPRSVCRLKTLTHLRLDNNRLTRLPDNCFTNLTALMSLSASVNNITELQDGLFDGLCHLEKLQLGNNRISSIGLRVFNRSAMLTSLRYVDLHGNRIQTLEPWPYYVGINGQTNHKTPIDLSDNNISAFTNMMGWKAKCGMKIAHFDLKLSYNPIKHLRDILRGWNMSLLTWWCLNPYRNRATSYIDLYNSLLDCDCVDFSILKLILATYSHNYLVNGVYCSRPAALYNRPVISVPLDQLVCELTEHCPPSCRCVHRPANSTLHIYCSNTNITFLPSQLPELPKSYTKYKLDFSNNILLRRLEQRAYFVNTSILDASNCQLDSIDFELWKELANIPQVFLDGNQLQSLPSLVTTTTLAKTKLSFSKNPWKCFCDASWMPDWLNLVQKSIINPDSIICSSPPRLENRVVMGISEEQFCVDPKKRAVKIAVIVSTLTVAGVVVVLLTAGFIVYHLRIRLYTRWKFRPFDRDECPGEDMDYDLFLSCSSNDNLPHGNGIREQLEQRGYHVCYPPRDFLAGGTIQDNIYNAVVRSKRVVCFLTTQFLQRSVWTMCENFKCRSIRIASAFICIDRVK